MPLRRAAVCPDTDDGRTESASAIQLGGTIDVLDADLQVPGPDLDC
jgi:hypothetical protein